MGLEVTTTIAGLDSAWPLAGDSVSSGDDHLRLIKTVLKTVFPGAGGSGFSTQITAKESEINYLVGVTSAIQTQLNAKLALAGGTLTGALNETEGAAIASAATVDLTAATGNFLHITGTTTITGITVGQGAERVVVFDDTLTLTHSATLILPGAANITTAAGDVAAFRGEGAGVTRCVVYSKADGTTVNPSIAATQAQMEAASSNTVHATPGNVNWHPGVAKCWLACSYFGTIKSSYNITSITDTGTGKLNVTIATDFSSGNFAASVTTISSYLMAFFSAAHGASTMQAWAIDPSGVLTDPDTWNIIAFGDQA